MGQALNLAVERIPLVGQGPITLYTNSTSLAAIEAVSDSLIHLGGHSPHFTVIPVFIHHDDQVAQVPLFRVQTPKGDQFVDHIGRTYPSFVDYNKTIAYQPLIFCP